jgi:mannitol/fructose-specific phosphotransferase system IIA component (Ntr-type)
MEANGPMILENYLDKTQVFFLKNTEKQVVIKEMLQRLEKLGKIEHSDRYYAQVIHRESLENTGVGAGLAIPHARTDSVNSFISILGVSTEGIDYQSFDNAPVRYVLLSIFPTDMSTKYLYLVGMMARIFSNEEKRRELDEATTPAKVYSKLAKDAKQYFESISQKEEPGSDGSVNLSGVPSSDLDLLLRLDSLYPLLDEDKNADSTGKKIEGLRKLIDNRSLTYYERMRKKCQNPFAIVDKSSCSGCHLEIPPIYLKQIKESKGISVCTHCGRFLIIL